MDKTKAKYKTGDRVRVRADLISNRRYSMANGASDVAVPEMLALGGKIVTIKEVSKYGYRIKEDGHMQPYRWTDEMFEPTQPIIIYHKGDRVIALDKNTGKKGVAKCSPDDRFDFCVGAKLAFDKLMERGPRFKVGDVVVGLPEADDEYCITRSGWKGLVNQVLEREIQVTGIDKDGTIRKFNVNPKYFRKIEEEKNGEHERTDT